MFDGHVVLAQARLFRRDVRRRGRGHRRQRPLVFLSLAKVVLPAFLLDFVEFDSSLPIAQTIGKIADHPPLDLGQHVTQKTICARGLARAAVADHHHPKMRRLAPSWPGLRPPRVADQRRDACEQRPGDIIDRAGRSSSRIGKPSAPGIAEDLERQRRRRPPSKPQHAHIGFAPTIAVGAVRLSRRIARARGAVVPPELLAPRLGVGVESFSAIGVGFLSARHRWAP